MENEQTVLALSRTAQTYARLYQNGRVDEEGLRRAAARGLISAEEMQFITEEGEAA